MNKNTTIVDSGISINHAKTWKATEAIREIVQNWIDVTHEYGVRGSIRWEDGKGIIEDLGGGLQRKHFAFGESEKDETAIGQFGEGLKSAIIYLVRNGRDIDIETAEFKVTPEMQISEIFQIPTLHYLFQAPSGIVSKGTRISFECSREELEEAKQYFTHFAKEDVHFTWLDEEERFSLPGGKLYINGSLICDIGSAISYHLYGEQASELVNRDRNNYNDKGKLIDQIGKTLEEYSGKQVAEILLREMVNGDDTLENGIYLHQYMSISYKLKLWKQVWDNTIAPNISSRPLALATYSSESNAIAEYHGFQLIHPNSGPIRSFLSQFVPFADRAVQEKQEKESIRIRQKNLTPTEQYNLRTAKALARKHYKDLGGRLGHVEVYDKLYASGGTEAQGLYDRSTDVIKLSRSILDNLYPTLFVLIHELVHKVSGADDLTVSFETALLQVGVDMMLEDQRKRDERRIRREQKQMAKGD